jgi:hypothetical protein
MRTTITIDDHLLERLKKRASDTGTSVSALVEDAIRLFLNRTGPAMRAERKFELVTFGAGGSFSKLPIDKTSELVAFEDDERFGTNRR